MKQTIKALLGVGLLASTMALASSAIAQTAVTFQLNWTAGGANAGFAIRRSTMSAAMSRRVPKPWCNR